MGPIHLCMSPAATRNRNLAYRVLFFLFAIYVFISSNLCFFCLVIRSELVRLTKGVPLFCIATLGVQKFVLNVGAICVPTQPCIASSPCRVLRCVGSP